MNDTIFPLIHGMSTSGNCHKIRMLLEHLDIPYRWNEVDIMTGGTQTPEFLAMNPNGKVPVVEIAPDRYLSESNAVLCHYGEGTSLLPGDPWVRARCLQWLFFEQYSHEPCIAVARFICRFLDADHPRRAELPQLHDRGYKALAVMEQQLAADDFLVEQHYTVADIALFAYTHRAHEGGYQLGEFPAIRAWLERVQATPGFVAMPDTHPAS